MRVFGSRAGSEPVDSGSTALTLPPPPQPGLLPALLPAPPLGAEAQGKAGEGSSPGARSQRVAAQPRPRPVLSVAHGDSAWGGGGSEAGELGSWQLVQQGGHESAQGLVSSPGIPALWKA